MWWDMNKNPPTITVRPLTVKAVIQVHNQYFSTDYYQKEALGQVQFFFCLVYRSGVLFRSHRVSLVVVQFEYIL